MNIYLYFKFYNEDSFKLFKWKVNVKKRERELNYKINISFNYFFLHCYNKLLFYII